MTHLKTTALLLLVNALGFTALAQTKTADANTGTHLSVGFDIGRPTGYVAHKNSLSRGLSLQVELPLAKRLFATFNTGYTNFIGNYEQVWDGSIYLGNGMQLIPLKAGIKVFAIDKFYFQGEAGASFLLNSVKTGYSRSVAFIYAPQFGVVLPTSTGKGNYDVGIRYENSGAYAAYKSSNIGFVALRLAYRF